MKPRPASVIARQWHPNTTGVFIHKTGTTEPITNVITEADMVVFCLGEGKTAHYLKVLADEPVKVWTDTPAKPANNNTTVMRKGKSAKTTRAERERRRADNRAKRLAAQPGKGKKG